MHSFALPYNKGWTMMRTCDLSHTVPLSHLISNGHYVQTKTGVVHKTLKVLHIYYKSFSCQTASNISLSQRKQHKISNPCFCLSIMNQEHENKIIQLHYMNVNSNTVNSLFVSLFTALSILLELKPKHKGLWEIWTQTQKGKASLFSFPPPQPLLSPVFEREGCEQSILCTII